MPTKRGKVDAESRDFNEKWESKYVFINRFSKPTCLICNVYVALNKEFNTKRHCHTKHANFFKFTDQTM